MDNLIKQNIYDYLKLIIISIIIIAIYDGISYNITDNLYTKGTHSVLTIEFVLILFTITIFYFPKIENKILKYIFPLIPIITLYTIFDIFYSFLLRSPKISDLSNFSNIQDFSLSMFILIIISFISIISLLAIMIIKAKPFYSTNGYIATISIRIMILIIFILFLSTNIFKNYQKNNFDYLVWSHKQTIKNNGKISSFIFYYNLEDENKKKIKPQKNINIIKSLYPTKIVEKQNIYYVVLESFINPNYLKNIIYSRNPLSNKLKPYLYKNSFSNIISPVYGGNTAQAEFELLTGIKALGKVNTTDFNVLTGRKINSFLSQLKKYNYHTQATIGTHSGYFNSTSAYKSIGLDEVKFLEEEKNFKKNILDSFIFDGDLYKYNLNIIKKHLNTSKKPLFSYILGMYGHIPFYRNIKDRPDRVVVKQNNTIHKIANQFYYRTKALANYIKEIIKIDPNSIIVVSSDHIPPILNKDISYKYDNHTNISLMINRGIPIDISNKNQYQIPWIIWDILSNIHTDRNNSPKFIEKLYFKALYNGTKGKK